jgi:UDP-galactopyranose mutase
LLVEQRNHIGGNTYDYFNDDGILVKKYGPHIFHTNYQNVWEYLNLFTRFNNYVHHVIANVRGKEMYLPITIETLEKLYDYPFDEQSMKVFLDSRKISIPVIKNSEDVILSQLGRELYDLFFKYYTKKQWGVYPDQLDAAVTSRLPVRFNRDTRYFTDQFQGIPELGYTEMFKRMLDHKNITVQLNTDYKDIVDSIEFSNMIYTGPIDQFFNYQFGKLPYRCLEFKFKTLDIEKYQNGSVVNFPNEFEYTRITEFKHFYFQKHPKTTICYEFPFSEGDPYYPIPNTENKIMYEKYRCEADKLQNVRFVGRLAQYAYMNMDQVVKNSLGLFEKMRQAAL